MSRPARVLPLLLLLFTGVHSASTPAPVPGLTPGETGKRIVRAILKDLPPDSIAPYFEEDVRPSLTPETIHGMREEMIWLAGFIGDSLDLFLSGTRRHNDSETVFFREYRFVNESSKRAPLIVPHFYFRDSLAVKAAGAFIKTFLEDLENRITGEQAWTVRGRDVDVHSVGFVELDSGRALIVVRVLDDDTTFLDSAGVIAKCAPLARETVSRGFLAPGRAELKGKIPVEDIGFLFIRKDPRFGYARDEVLLAPEQYRLPATAPAPGKAPGKKPAPPRSK